MRNKLRKIDNSDPFMLRLWQSGRELFHSNVLASLIEEPKYGPDLLEIVTGDGYWNNYEIRCLREEWRIDILVVAILKQTNGPEAPELEACRIVAIENKFKSLPDRGQLMRYGKKLNVVFQPPSPPYQENCSRKCRVGCKTLRDLWDKAEFGLDDDEVEEPIEDDAELKITNRQKVSCKLYRALLQPTVKISPASPCPFVGGLTCPVECVEVPASNVNSERWRVTSYEDLMQSIVQLQQAQTTSAPCPGFQELFLDKYTELVSAACALHKCLRQHMHGNNPFADIDQNRPRVNKLRIWDFVDKWRYAWLSELVDRKLVASFSSGNVTDFLGYQNGKLSLPDLPGRVMRYQTILQKSLFELHCWIAVNTYYSHGNSSTTILLLPYLVDTQKNPIGFHAGKYAIEIQLQAGFLKLMLGADNNMPTDSIISQRLNEVNIGCNWKKNNNGQNGLGKYGNGQKVILLTLLADCKRCNGKVRYWSAEKWPIKQPTSGLWHGFSAHKIATDMVAQTQVVLQNLASVAINGSGTPNTDWFI